MPLHIPSPVAQVAYTKINALKDAISALPPSPEKDAAAAAEFDLHAFAHIAFTAIGGVYIAADDHAALATTTAPSVIVTPFSVGGGGK